LCTLNYISGSWIGTTEYVRVSYLLLKIVYAGGRTYRGVAANVYFLATGRRTILMGRTKTIQGENVLPEVVMVIKESLPASK